MTREDWLTACAARFVERGGMTEGDALDMAKTCAENEAENNGDDPDKWEPPVDCANEEMSYWADG